MGRPARVSNAGVSGQLALLTGDGEFGDPPGAAQALQFSINNDGNTGRIVAAVFQAPQAFQQQRYNVTTCDGRDNSAHR